MDIDINKLVTPEQRAIIELSNRIEKLEKGLRDLDRIMSQYGRSDGSEDEKALEFVRGASYVRSAVNSAVDKILAK